MSLPKRIESYPSALVELFEELIKQGESRVLTFKTNAEAQKIRMYMYGLRVAIEKEKKHPLKGKLYTFTLQIPPKGKPGDNTIIVTFTDDTNIAATANSLLEQVRNA